MASPSPAPDESGVRQNRSNARAAVAASIPVPVSLTASSWPSARARTCTSMQTAAGRVPQRVHDEVRDDLADAQRIEIEGREVGVRVNVQSDSRFVRLRLEGGDGVGGDGSEIDRFTLKRQGVGIGQREGAKVIDQPLELTGLGQDSLEMLGIGRIQTVDHALDVALDDGQRRPQLVADIGNQAPTLLLRLSQSRAHGIERARQGADLPRASLGNLCSELAGLDPGRGLDQVAHRCNGESSRPNKPSQDQGDDHQESRPEYRGYPSGPEQGGEHPRQRGSEDEQDEHERGDKTRGATSKAAPHGPPGIGALGWERLTLRPPRRSLATAPPRAPAPGRASTLSRQGGTPRRTPSGDSVAIAGRARSFDGCS